MNYRIPRMLLVAAIVATGASACRPARLSWNSSHGLLRMRLDTRPGKRSAHNDATNAPVECAMRLIPPGRTSLLAVRSAVSVSSAAVMSSCGPPGKDSNAEAVGARAAAVMAPTRSTGSVRSTTGWTRARPPQSCPPPRLIRSWPGTCSVRGSRRYFAAIQSNSRESKPCREPRPIPAPRPSPSFASSLRRKAA